MHKEDVWVNSESASLICAADADVVAAGKVRPRALRKAVKALLDRNLLQGSFAQAGVKQHDMVCNLRWQLAEYFTTDIVAFTGQRTGQEAHWRSYAGKAEGGGTRVRHRRS